jgi:hypothetical protein
VTPLGLFAFSADLAHKSRDVVLSPDGLVATVAAGGEFGWVRSERGIAAGSGVTRWTIQLGDGGGRVYKIGVVSHAFRSYSDCGWPRLMWMFQNDAAAADGAQIGSFLSCPCFDQGDIVMLELERRPGVDSVLRVGVVARTPWEMRGLPEGGVLYPIVCVANDRQAVTVLPAPASSVAFPAQQPQLCSEAVSPASSPRTGTRMSRAAARAGVFAFSDARTRLGELMHRSADVTLSLDRLTATKAAGKQCGWVRAERGIGAGSGVVSWHVP